MLTRNRVDLLMEEEELLSLLCLAEQQEKVKKRKRCVQIQNKNKIKVVQDITKLHMAYETNFQLTFNWCDCSGASPHGFRFWVEC